MGNKSNGYCLIHSLPGLYEEYAPIPPESLLRKLRLFIRRNLNPLQVRTFKTKTSRLIDRASVFTGIKKTTPAFVDDPPISKLRPGDVVRVRTLEEIRTTLDHWGQLKGCAFMLQGMSPYCGTIQKVFKPMERFVDERDYHVKKVHGIVLLQGLHCEGTSDYGRCDRACFYFWREEWLEKIRDADAETLA